MKKEVRSSTEKGEEVIMKGARVKSCRIEIAAVGMTRKQERLKE